MREDFSKHYLPSIVASGLFVFNGLLFLSKSPGVFWVCVVGIQGILMGLLTYRHGKASYYGGKADAYGEMIRRGVERKRGRN